MDRITRFDRRPGSVRTPTLWTITMLVGLAVALVGCSGGAALASPAASSAASAAPSVAASAPASIAPNGAPATVTTKEQAVDAVIAQEPRFLGITEKDPDMIGQASWFEVKPASGVGAFVVTMRVGWGDCPAGCIEQHLWTYAVAPDGAVTLQSQTGTDVPPNAWPAHGGAGAEG
jgi:hypothetical protein